MKKILLLFLMLCFALPSLAANWVEVGYKRYIDSSSLKRSYGYGYNNNRSPQSASAWFKTLNSGNWEKLNNKQIWFLKDFVSADCTLKKIRINTSVCYDLKGNVIGSNDVPGSWQNVVPDSVGEQTYTALCCTPNYFNRKYINKEDWKSINNDTFIDLNSIKWDKDLKTFTLKERVYKNKKNKKWFNSLTKKASYANIILFFNTKTAEISVKEITCFNKYDETIFKTQNLYSQNFSVFDNPFNSYDILKFLYSELEKELDFKKE